MVELAGRYSRQILFSGIGSEGQKRLLSSKVLIIGLGALGTVIANNLARAGVGRLRLVDRDFVEESNLQRQVLYDEEDAAKAIPKAVAAANKLRLINSSIEYEPVVKDVNFTNIEDLMVGVDLVLDGTDNMEIRNLINEACVKLGIPWVYGGCVGSSGMTMTIVPHETACLHCVFPPENGHHGETCDTVGVINPAPNVVGSIETTEALKILVGAKGNINQGLTVIDLWENCYSTVTVLKDPECAVCGKGVFRYLNGVGGLRTTVLCGRNAVQVVPHSPVQISLSVLRSKLEPLGDVHDNGFLLTFQTGPYKLVVFEDGRAIIKGTDDETTARTIYARYVGA